MPGFRIDDEQDEVTSEINMVPLIDVMRVLLIEFIITMPVMNHSVNVQLPRAALDKELQPATLRLTVQADGSYLLGDEGVGDAELATRLQTAAAALPPPDLHLRGDRAVRFERVVQAMAATQQVGLAKIGFVTEPPRGAP